MQSEQRQNLRYQRWALLLGVLLFAFKFGAFLLTHSNSILTDALEGLANVLGAGFGWFSLYYASKPKDINHPYGHGKIEFISSGFEGGLVLVAGVGMIGRSVYSFFHPHAVEITLEALALVTFAGGLNFGLGRIMVVQGRKTDSLQLQAGGFHLVSDGYTTLGLLVGIFVVWLTQYWWLDNVLAILLGVMISFSAIKIIVKAIDGILDKSDVALIEDLAKKIQQERLPEWVDIHHVRIVKYGSFYHMDAHLTLPWYYSLRQAHALVDQFEETVHHIGGRKIESEIHFEPCNANSCPICLVSNCPERQHAFVKKVKWDKTHILEDAHHSL